MLETASSQNLINLNLDDKQNLLPLEKTDIGYEAKRLLKDAKCSPRDELAFKSDFQKLIVQTVMKLLDKSPIKIRFVRGLTCFDPKVIINFSEIASNRVDIVLETLNETDKIKGEVADRAKKQYQKLLSESQRKWRQKFEDF